MPEEGRALLPEPWGHWMELFGSPLAKPPGVLEAGG